MGKGLEDYDWVFRVASSQRSGGGHVARCLTLATALSKLGAAVMFVLDDDGQGRGAEIKAAGFAWVAAGDMAGGQIPACVVDGYYFDDDTLNHWRQRTTMMTAISDQPPVPAWAELTLAPGLDPDTGAPSGRRVLAGLRYALIDPCHLARTLTETGPVKNILVSFGLRDSLNATLLTLQALGRLAEILKGGISVTVAMGPSAPHLPAIAGHVRTMKNAVCKIEPDMTICYARADLAIGGGGVGLLERMAQGLASVSIVLADNQARQIESCAKTGGTLNAGPIDHLNADNLAAEIGPLLRSAERRTTMSVMARKAVDGRGAERCAKIMLELAVAN